MLISRSERGLPLAESKQLASTSRSYKPLNEAFFEHVGGLLQSPMERSHKQVWHPLARQVSDVALLDTFIFFER